MKTRELAELLESPSKNFDGHLVLNSRDTTWTLIFVQGQLLYAVDDVHATRRWLRLLKQYFPRWNWQVIAAQFADHQSWQVYLINQGINQQHLSLIRAKLAIRAITQECLFELSHCQSLKSHWQPDSLAVSITCRSVGLSSWEMKMTLNKVELMCQQWQQAGLEQISPILSPMLTKSVETQMLPVDPQYLSGNFTLWDIAGHHDQSLVEVTQSLLPLFKDRTIELRKVPDLPIPPPDSQTPPPSKLRLQPKTTRSSRTQTSVTTKPPASKSKSVAPGHPQPVIACIDDSPVLAHSLKKILVGAGYRVLMIQEPMRGFSQLIEHKPNLILLDLLLPNADGYSICKFLRDTPVFEKTPIIILTGQNSSIDRARARLAGATEFLTKPPEPQKLLDMIQKHLGEL